MGKGKPRHNPNKPANLMGKHCPRYEEIPTDKGVIYYCHGGAYNDAKKCNGNPHNCVKTLYARAASRSDKQINDDVFRRR